MIDKALILPEMEIVSRAKAYNDIASFIPYVSPLFDKPRHLIPIVDILNRILSGEVLKVCFSVPPQHWKSVTVGHFEARYLDKYRTHNLTYASYEQTFAESQTRLPKRLLKELGVVPEKDTAKEFVLQEGGSLFTTSTGGGMTGRPQNGLILDDLIKNREEAESKTYRDKVYDWFFSAVDTREREGITWLVLFMTRWHEDDLIGRLIKEKYDIINIRIPALYDGLDSYGKPEPHTKELETPLYYSKEFYLKKQKQNEYVYNGMYQGLPKGRGNTLFKDVMYYSKLPENYKIQIGADFAYTEETKADHSCIVVMYVADGKYYIVDVKWYQKEIDYTYDLVVAMYNKYLVPIAIENNGPQKAVADTIAKKIGEQKIKRMNPTNDKYTRSLPFASEWNLGNILLPDPNVYPNNWLIDYIDELQAFTGKKKDIDDQVDASVYAFGNTYFQPMMYGIN